MTSEADSINNSPRQTPSLTERVSQLEERLRLAEAADLGHLELIANLEKRIALAEQAARKER